MFYGRGEIEMRTPVKSALAIEEESASLAVS
jgi:hypothetical protein